jgi:serine/threonine protein kinase/Tol biopolymer transport system component
MSMIRKTLAHYEITSQLGKGGMGEVYRAKDQKLGRDVAIKVLPEEFARDAERIARFEREAKVLASLNHPNIAAIHGLEEVEGTHFLVLELVGGDTLADQLKHRAIPVEESLKLALQIAEALEAAHEKGVIHRDLKPANIKVTPDGKVKVLDFGLAKAFAAEQADLNLSNSPTLSNAATQQGVILGTAAYMSPEQAKGKAVDRRSDIWAFGCVVYEMLTGRAVFQAEDISEILASVIKAEANLDLLPAGLHPALRQLIFRCLQKDLKKRYQDIGDVRYEIERAMAESSGVWVQPVAGGEPCRKFRTMFPWVAVAIVLGAIIAGVAVWKLKPSEPHRVVRFDDEMPDGLQFSDLGSQALAVSPDGKHFAYSTLKGLCLRSIDEGGARLIAEAGGETRQPFFSPDGKWIGYVSVAEGSLKKIPVGGGAPVTVCATATTTGGYFWTPDNRIIQGFGVNIRSVSADGGEWETLSEEKAFGVGFPQLLPDGESMLFTVGTAPPRKIMLLSLKSGKSRELFEGGCARYIKTGHIVYGLGNNLYARPFNSGTLEVTGGPISIVEGAANVSWVWHYDVSDTGVLVYIPETSAARRYALAWVDLKGEAEPLSAVPGDYRTPRISPDGKKLALTISAGGKGDIWIWDIVRETMTRSTFNGDSDASLWTPDGRRIVYRSTRDGTLANIYWKAADGTGAEERLRSTFNSWNMPWSWSRNGTEIVLVESDLSKRSNQNIGMLSMQGSHEWRPLLNQEYEEGQPKISPDGKWLAYASNESGRYDIYVRPFPEVDKGKWPVSQDGGNSPLWRPDGRALFYRSGEAVMAVSVETEQLFKAGKPEMLFRNQYVQWNSNDNQPWDIHPDGKRFLMMKPSDSSGESPTAAPQKISVVVNWFEELKRRALIK